MPVGRPNGRHGWQDFFLHETGTGTGRGLPLAVTSCLIGKQKLRGRREVAVVKKPEDYIRWIVPIVVPNTTGIETPGYNYVMEIQATDDIDKSFDNWRQRWEFDWMPTCAFRVDQYDFEIRAQMQVPGRITLEEASKFTRNAPTQFDAHDAVFGQYAHLGDKMIPMYNEYERARVAVDIAFPHPPKPPRETEMMFEMRMRQEYEERLAVRQFEWDMEHNYEPLEPIQSVGPGQADDE